jgi:2-oxoglutarate dehydrogenase E1 component
VPHLPVINAFAERAKQGTHQGRRASGADSELGRKRTAVQQLIAAYRNVGCRWADLDPLKRTERENIPELEPSFYGFTAADQETVFNTSNTFFGKDSMSLRDLTTRCARPTAARSAPSTCTSATRAASAGGSRSSKVARSKPEFSAEKKKHILDRLTAAEGLERFLHTKYVGQKRFSLEGGESFIARWTS